MHKTSPISLKCCLKAHGYLQVRRISMFALNCTITSVLASKVTVKVVLRVLLEWPQCELREQKQNKNTQKKKKKKRNSLKLLLLLFFKNKKCWKKKKKKERNQITQNLGHFCNRFNPSRNKQPCNCQTNPSTSFVDAKESFDSQTAQPEPGNLSR